MSACIGGCLLVIWPIGAEAAVDPDVQSFYLITLSQTPLPEAADAVLVKSLRSNVRIDDGVNADITLAIAKQMTAEDLEIAFAAALADHGIVQVREEGGFRLADLAVAMGETPRPVIVGAPLPAPKSAFVHPETVASEVIPTSDARGLSLWIYSALTLIAAVAAALGIRFSSPVLARLRGVRAPLLKGGQAEGADRDAVVDWILSRRRIPLPLLASACDRAARLGRPVERALFDVGAVTEAFLADAYCAVTGLSRWDTATAPAIVSGDSVLDRFVRDHDLHIVEIDDWSVVVACADPLDDRVYATLSRRAKRMVTLRVGCLSQVTPEQPTVAASGAETQAPPVIVPWSQPRPDGARLLQAILARRETDQAPNAHSPQ